MSKRLDENLGTVGYDGLIVTNEPVADVVTVTLAASQGVLARGTVITGVAGGELSAAAAALVATNAVYILADETDTGTGVKFPKWARLYLKYVLPLMILIIFIMGYVPKIQAWMAM